MYVGLHVMYGYSCQTAMKVEFLDIFSRRNIKFHENPSSGGRVVRCDIKKLIFAFPNFANAANKTGRSFKLPTMSIRSEVM
jgi:hypothetical protein